MNIRKTSLVAVAAAFAATVAAVAQQPAAPAPLPEIGNPTRPCNLTPAQIEEGRKVALMFFQQGVDRLTLADPSYKQHNPAFKKRAEEAGISDFEEFKNAFAPRAGGPGAGGRQGGGGGGRGRANAPTPPGPNNALDIVLTECDITVAIHRNWRQDPVTPGRWFEAYTFDAFRVRNGKLVEHWDTAVINPPAAAPAGGAPAAGRGN
jgi:predicted SnoaL-like aldol condensation-catalyzing enzyme